MQAINAMSALRDEWGRSIASAFGRVFAAIVFAGIASGAIAAPPEGRGRDFAPGRVLVAPAAGNDDPEFHGALAVHGGRSRGRLMGMDVHLVDVPPGWERDIAEIVPGSRNRTFSSSRLPSTPSVKMMSAFATEAASANATAPARKPFFR